MRHANDDIGDSYESLTRAALLLESRKVRDSVVKFPEECKWLNALNAISYGGEIRAEHLGSLLYYIADIMENADNWK